LTPEQSDAFCALPAYDQIHLIAVFERLRSGGPDLLIAGLLHDIGKADQRGRVRLVDRVARVVLRQATPRLLARLAASPGNQLLHGLHLCVHHPRLGAERAKALGCSDRAVWLIAHHEDREPGNDPELIALQAADRG
jgi:hypothetical protein